MERSTNKMRHIAIRYHFVRDLVEKGRITIVWTGSAANVSDIFTKPLQKQLFRKHASALTVELNA